MERGSDKHSPMLDDELKHQTEALVDGAPAEARAQEGREQEGPAEGEPTPDARIRGERGGPVNGMSSDEVNDRAELARYLEPSVFPARPAALVETARSNFAPDGALRRLERLPDETYGNVAEVWTAMGGRTEPDAHSGRHFDDPPGMDDGSTG